MVGAGPRVSVRPGWWQADVGSGREERVMGSRARSLDHGTRRVPDWRRYEGSRSLIKYKQKSEN